MAKKIFMFVIAAVLIIGNLGLLVSCSSNAQVNQGTTVNESRSIADIVENDDTEPGIDQSSVTTMTEISIEEQVILEQDGIKITVKSLDFEDFWGPTLKLLIENNSEKSITVQTRKSTVNGVMIDGMISCDVATGKKANDGITFSSTEL